MTYLISDTEAARLDDLTKYTSTLLNHIEGEALDALGLGKRYTRSDREFRQHLLNNTHPDDLVTELATRGYTLAKLGIVEIR